MSFLMGYIEIFAALIAVFSPLSALPVFASLTSNMNEKDKKHTAKVAAISACTAGIISVWIGQYVLMFFGISIYSFKVAGGILLLLMAISMLNAKVPTAKTTPKEIEEAKEKILTKGSEIAVVPLAIPLIAGPGAISTIIIYSQKIPTISHLISMTILIIFMSTYIYYALKMASFLSKKLGISGMSIVSRVMGLFLASISVEFITSGLMNIFPILAYSK